MENPILIRLRGRAPRRWLAMSAKIAVAVQLSATIKEIISPRCCISGIAGYSLRWP